MNRINYVNSKIPNYINEIRPELGKHTLAILNNNFYFKVDKVVNGNNLMVQRNPAQLLIDDNYGVPLFGLTGYCYSLYDPYAQLL